MLSVTVPPSSCMKRNSHDNTFSSYKGHLAYPVCKIININSWLKHLFTVTMLYEDIWQGCFISKLLSVHGVRKLHTSKKYLKFSWSKDFGGFFVCWGGGVIRTFLSSYKLLFLFSSCTVWVPWLSSTSFLKLLATILHIDKNDLSIAVYGISRYGLSHPALVTSMWPHWVVCKYFPFAFWVVVKLVKVQHKPETENAILRAEVVSSS